MPGLLVSWMMLLKVLGCYGKATALLNLLVNIRKLYWARDDELIALKETTDSLIQRVRITENAVTRCQALSQEVDALKDRLRGFSSSLHKIIAEFRRMDPPVPGMDPADPCNFLLQQWHPEEISLRPKLVDWWTRVPQLVNERIGSIEHSFNEREVTNCRREFAAGQSIGFHRGQEVVERFHHIVFPGDHIDGFMRNIIEAMEDPGGDRWGTMLRCFKAAILESKEGGNEIPFLKEH